MKWALIAVFAVIGCSKKPAPAPEERPAEIIEASEEVFAVLPADPDAVAMKLPRNAQFPAIVFPFDSDLLIDRDLATTLAEYLRETGQSVHLEGHACHIGPERYNDVLGLRRAVSVGDWLVEQGVPPERIQVSSQGEKEPAFLNPAENRRVEILIQE